jgi:hypothetical protein
MVERVVPGSHSAGSGEPSASVFLYVLNLETQASKIGFCNMSFLLMRICIGLSEHHFIGAFDSRTYAYKPNRTW